MARVLIQQTRGEGECSMYRILFMPLLQIPSGHHHVARSIEDDLNQSKEHFHCEHIELLSYSFGKLEKIISSVYLQWIERFPESYSAIYKLAAVKNENQRKHFYMYEIIFLKYIQRIIMQAKPDLVICTHALPSYLLNRMKEKKRWSGIVINVYTDYFVNNLWGIHQIDYHFTPNTIVKNHLLKRGVDPQQIYVTGIPVHPMFRVEKHALNKKNNYTILISGGNMGAGSIEKLINQINPSGSVNYLVLCGKNKKLYKKVMQLNHSCIHPLPYIQSKKEMNQIYDQIDAIITKPGGVTISESLWKRIPIFVYKALPGQEEINLTNLKNQGLVFHLSNWEQIEHTITSHLANELPQFHERLNNYIHTIEKQPPHQIIQEILHGACHSPNFVE